FGEHAHGPAAGFVSGDGDGSVVQGFRLIDDLGDGDVRGRAQSLTVRAHAAVDGEGLAFDLLALALVDGHRALAAEGGDVEGIRVRRSEVRFCQTGEEGAQLRVDIRSGAPGRTRGRPDALPVGGADGKRGADG